MRLDPAAAPFVIAAVVAAALPAALGHWRWGMPGLVAVAFFLFFFRDPERTSSTSARGDVLSPADGRVLVAGMASPEVAPAGIWQQISIFLSPLDVHVNRVPVGGRVTRIALHRGSYLPAYRSEAAIQNERSEIWVDANGRTVVFRQIVGMLARRVVCRLREGQTVRAGERFGIMKFGSRMDVFVPPDADVCVAVGDHVRGGETVLAKLA